MRILSVIIRTQFTFSVQLYGQVDITYEYNLLAIERRLLAEANDFDDGCWQNISSPKTKIIIKLVKI